MEDKLGQSSEPINSEGRGARAIKKAGVIAVMVFAIAAFLAGSCYLALQFVQHKAALEPASDTAIQKGDDTEGAAEKDSDENWQQDGISGFSQTDTIIDLSPIDRLAEELEAEIESFGKTEESIMLLDSGAEIDEVLGELENFSFD